MTRGTNDRGLFKGMLIARRLNYPSGRLRERRLNDVYL